MPFLPITALAIALMAPPQSSYVRDFAKPAPMLPQTQPFIQYTKPAYDFNLTAEEADAMGIVSKRPKHWWSGDLAGMKVGGPLLGDEVPFGRGANLVRAAYGMRHWGMIIDDKGIVDKADRMARLFLSQAVEGEIPESYNLKTKKAKYGPHPGHGGFTSAVWLSRWLSDFPDVDFASEAKRFIDRTRNAAMVDKNNVDHAWFLAVDLEKGNVKASDVREIIADGLRGDKSSPETIRLAGAVARGPLAGDFRAQLRAIADALPKTESGIANGVVLDGYVYGGKNPDIWQDAALAALDLGAFLDDPAIFEQGAKMIRATLTDFMAPNMVGNSLALPRGMMDGRAVNGDFGRSFAPKYQGFASGEGHTLATLVISRQEYGSVYYGKSGWAVGIDGIMLVDGKPYSGLSLNPTSYDSHFPATVRRFGQKNAEKIGQPPLISAIREIVVEYRDDQAVVVARTNAVLFTGDPDPKGVFILADGTRLPANPGPGGFESPVVATDLGGPIAFEGSLGGSSLKAKGAQVTMTPRFRSSEAWMSMGRMSSAFSSGAISSKNEAAWGELRSEAFTSPYKTLTFTWSGSGDAAVELWDIDEAEVLRRTTVPSEREATITWDISALSNRRLQIRVIDNAPEAWIAVHDFRLR